MLGNEIKIGDMRRKTEVKTVLLDTLVFNNWTNIFSNIKDDLYYTR